VSLFIEETNRNQRTKPRHMPPAPTAATEGPAVRCASPAQHPIPRSHRPPRTFTLTLGPAYFFDAGAIINFPSSSLSSTITRFCSAFFFCVCASRAASATVSGRIPDSTTPNATASP
jgi:hypothetical protein